MNRQTLLILAAFAIALPMEVLAETWCSQTYGTDAACNYSALWCEDLDRLCLDSMGKPACPPLPPEPCPDTYGIALFHHIFVRTSSINDGPNLCGVEFKQEDEDIWVSSQYFGTRFPNRQGGLGQATVDLRDEIQRKWGTAYNRMIGTDQNPLVLRFDMCGGNGVAGDWLHVKYDIGVMELFLDNPGAPPNTKRSPMDYILVGADNGAGCINCNSLCQQQEPPTTGAQVAWPFVCQSYETRAEAPLCPPLQTNVRSAIAIGANALLDNNPCHCEGTDQYSMNRYLSFYDGLKWRILNPDHPGPGGETLNWWTDHPSGNISECFVMGGPTNEIMLFVKTATVDIHHRTQININDQWQWVESRVTGIKREYTGPFDKMHAGASIGCEMNGSGGCVGNRTCLSEKFTRCDNSQNEIWGAKWLSFDNLALDGGLPDAEGACCFGGGGCADGHPVDCEAAEGHFAGPGTTCPDDCRGACCLPTGDCQDTQFDACPGNFSGFGTECATTACRGACCLSTGECLDTTPEACSGTFKGLGTDCATTVCACPSPFADTDGDLDVDQTDFALLQRCFSPSGDGFPETRCICFDRPEVGFPEGDGDVDMDDVAAFEACASGPGIPSACQ